MLNGYMNGAQMCILKTEVEYTANYLEICIYLSELYIAHMHVSGKFEGMYSAV